MTGQALVEAMASRQRNRCDAAFATDEQGRTLWAEMGDTCLIVKEMLRYHATHDPQTGLPNLDFMVEKTDQALASGKPCSLVFLMVLGVNEIGEHHGATAALHVLRTAADRIQETIKDIGFAARIHGELFVAVSSDPAPEAIAERLRAELVRPIPWQAEAFHLIVAAGVVRSKDGPGSAEGLMQAGYAAAKDGLAHDVRGGVKLFTPELGQRIEHQYQVEARLRSALAGGGLSLAMQAKVGAADGCLLGAEALIRWRDDQLGEVSPADFIPLAERNGSITDISTWVLRKALSETAKWQRAGLDLSIAVNLSAVDLHRPNLIADIRRALTESGCEPTRLIIELTESAVAEDPDLAIQQLYALKEMGIGLSLDDFGTGYSSLSYLHRFPIDSLKIDRSFVTDIPHDADAAAIVRSIVVLAHTLGMKTVAEGVETGDQAVFLRDLGVDVLQGYLFSRPIPPAQFMAMAMKAHGRTRAWSYANHALP